MFLQVVASSIYMQSPFLWWRWWVLLLFLRKIENLQLASASLPPDTLCIRHGWTFRIICHSIYHYYRHRYLSIYIFFFIILCIIIVMDKSDHH